jgi:hypothetical protein
VTGRGEVDLPVVGHRDSEKKFQTRFLPETALAKWRFYWRRDHDLLYRATDRVRECGRIGATRQVNCHPKIQEVLNRREWLEREKHPISLWFKRFDSK